MPAPRRHDGHPRMAEDCSPEESDEKRTPAVQAFIERFMKSKAGENASLENIVIDAFGDGESVQMADELLALVLAGTKTATCMSAWSWDQEFEVPLVPGMLSVILDGAKTPRCVVETISVTRLAYRDVTADFARAEGEHTPSDLDDDSVLKHWRAGHWAFYAKTLPLIGREPSQDMPVLCERFTVIYREDSRRSNRS